jgi:hypothetical protein
MTDREPSPAEVAAAWRRWLGLIAASPETRAARAAARPAEAEGPPGRTPERKASGGARPKRRRR